MRNFSFILCFLLFYGSGFPQQITQYSQYLLNVAAINPAATGFSSQTEVLFGRRSQWIGFENAPLVTFISLHKGIGKRVYKNYWNGVGVYIEEDKAGLYTNKQVQANYAFHLSLAKGVKLAFGTGIGMKIFSLTNIQSVTAGDPAFSGSSYSVPVFPDLSAGARIYTRKFFVDVSAKQILSNRAQSFGKSLGEETRLVPHAFLTAGKKFETEDYFFIFIPTLHLRMPFNSIIPSATAGGILFVNRRVGAGLYYRYPDAVYGVMQVRIVKNILIGMAYDYSLGHLRVVNANSVEIMVGISPGLNPDGFRDRPDKIMCPVFIQ